MKQDIRHYLRPIELPRLAEHIHMPNNLMRLKFRLHDACHDGCSSCHDCSSGFNCSSDSITVGSTWNHCCFIPWIGSCNNCLDISRCPNVCSDDDLWTSYWSCCQLHEWTPDCFNDGCSHDLRSKVRFCVLEFETHTNVIKKSFSLRSSDVT